jgi:soluble lytic murein transglycosylase
VKFVRFLLAFVWFLGAAAIVFWWWQGRLERSQDGPILAAGRRYSVDPALIKAIVWRESHFHPNARGRAHEIGLMQLQEEAAQQWADAEKLPSFVHEHCLDPVTNTLAGTFYLKQLLKRYERTDNPIPYALADYNAGRGNVLKWIQGAAATNSGLFQQQIGFPGTSNYVQAVMKRHQHYRETWGQSRK